jgi:two-component system cell cycle response regulator CtrA
MRILIVEPDAERAGRLQALFVEEHAVCDAIDSAEDLERGGLDYDALILNANSEPDTTQRLRTARVHVPIIVLVSCPDSRSARTRLHFLEQGADDVLCRPFLGRELLARAKAIVRRSAGHPGKVLTTGPLRLDQDDRSATVGGQPVHLSGREFALLEYLVIRVNRTVTKEQILAQIYQSEQREPDHKIIDVYICKLRKKLAEVCPAAAGLIETTWGRGYIIRERAAAPVLARAA